MIVGGDVSDAVRHSFEEKLAADVSAVVSASTNSSDQLQVYEHLLVKATMRIRRARNDTAGVNKIPRECLSMVFEQCVGPPGNRDENTLKRIVTVCSFWKEVAYGMVALWAVLPASGVTSTEAYAARSKQSVVALRVCHEGWLDQSPRPTVDSVRAAIAAASDRTRSLTLELDAVYAHDSLSTPAYVAWKHLTSGGFPGLTSLDVDRGDGWVGITSRELDAQDLSDILRSDALRQLRQLKVKNFGGVTLTHLPYLATLELTNAVDATSVDKTMAIVFGLPLLETLSIEVKAPQTDSLPTGTPTPARCHGLKTFHISGRSSSWVTALLERATVPADCHITLTLTDWRFIWSDQVHKAFERVRAPAGGPAYGCITVIFGDWGVETDVRWHRGDEPTQELTSRVFASGSRDVRVWAYLLQMYPGLKSLEWVGLDIKDGAYSTY